MQDIMHFMLVVFWSLGGVIALVALVSLLLFVAGLLRFIRHERHLARHWNRLKTIHVTSRPACPNKPDRCDPPRVS
jgi:hypothetical protein